MLVLTRNVGESILIGKDIKITMLRTGSQVRIGIEAPKEINIIREELLEVYFSKKV